MVTIILQLSKLLNKAKSLPGSSGSDIVICGEQGCAISKIIHNGKLAQVRNLVAFHEYRNNSKASLS